MIFRAFFLYVWGERTPQPFSPQKLTNANTSGFLLVAHLAPPAPRHLHVPFVPARASGVMKNPHFSTTTMGSGTAGTIGSEMYSLAFFWKVSCLCLFGSSLLFQINHMVGTQPPHIKFTKPYKAEELQHQLHFFLKGLALVDAEVFYSFFKSWLLASRWWNDKVKTVDWLLLVKR